MVTTTGAPVAARSSTRVAPSRSPKVSASARPTRAISSACASAVAKAPIRSDGIAVPAGSTTVHASASCRKTTVRPSRVSRTSWTSAGLRTGRNRGRAGSGAVSRSGRTRGRSTSQYSAARPASTTYATTTWRQRTSAPHPPDEEGDPDREEERRLEDGGGPEDGVALLRGDVEL